MSRYKNEDHNIKLIIEAVLCHLSLKMFVLSKEDRLNVKEHIVSICAQDLFPYLQMYVR